MKLLIISSLSIVFLGYITYKNLKKENLEHKLKYANNLSRELETIDSRVLYTDDIKIEKLLDDHGFFKDGLNKTCVSDLLNYSISKGYI